MGRPVWQRRPWLLACAFLLTLPAVTTRLYAADEFEYFAFLRSFWFDRDLSFANEYRYFLDSGATGDQGFRATFLDARTATGRQPNYGTVGSAILWAPFYSAADLLVQAGRLAGLDLRADGFSRPYIAAVTWASACYGFLALCLSAAITRRLGGSGGAAALAVGLGTPLIFYMYVAPGMSHACSAFAVALFIWTWLEVRREWTLRGVAALAAAAALMAMVREQEAFLALVPALDYVAGLAGSRGPGAPWLRPALVRAVAAAAVFALCYLPQAVAYLVLNGRLGPSPVIGSKMNWTAPWAGAVVFSPEHGWVFWTPLVLFSIAGLAATALGGGASDPRTVGSSDPRSVGSTGDRSRIAALLLLAILTQVYVSGSVASWTLAGAFGQRRFVGLTVCLVVGLGWLLARATSPAGRRLLVAAVGLAVWWNVGLAVQFGAGWMDRQRLEVGRNAYTTFVAVPRQAPALAWRYLFDRASFYETRGPASIR
jgi:hypothetical protein